MKTFICLFSASWFFFSPCLYADSLPLKGYLQCSNGPRLTGAVDAENQQEPWPSPLTLNDAIVNTLANQKEIQISIFNINKQEGVLQQSGGPFDPLLTESVTDVMANNVLKKPNAHFKSNDLLALGTIQKQTRSGTTFSLAGAYEYFTSHQIPHTRATQVVFQIDQPLLRNFLYGLNRQIERANYLELQAVQWDTLQTISDKILNTITTFWEVVGAQENVKVLENGIRRLDRLRDLTQQLIEGEQLAAEDINQTIAVIDTEKLNLLQAQGNLYAAKQRLLFAMGDFNESSSGSFEQKFVIAEDLPKMELDEEVLERKKDFLIQMAFDRRFDVLASVTREEVTNTLVIGAENQVLPQLDLIGSCTVNDLHPNFQTNVSLPGTLLTSQTSALEKNYSVNYAIGVSLSIPFYNDSALGFLEQQKSRNMQSILQTQLIKQNLINLILQTINNQMILHRQLGEADKIIHKYSRLVQDETERLQAGFGSVFVMLDFETKLIDAQISKVNLVRLYIQGMTTLRYLTGTLIDSDQTLCHVNVGDVLSYPE